jgi:hypothetical protein
MGIIPEKSSDLEMRNDGFGTVAATFDAPLAN